MIKKIISVLLVGLMIVGCTTQEKESSDKVKVVATLYPQYSILKELVEDYAEVSLLLPPGVEAHGYEPTPQDIVKLNDSDLFVYTSDHLESYAANISKSLDNKHVSILNLQDLLLEDLEDEDHADEHEGHDHAHGDHDHDDPHFWLDPVMMIDMTRVLRDEMIKIDPEHKDTYEINADRIIKDLEVLDQDFKKMFEEADKDTIVFVGHFAFDFFAQRYDMKYETPFESFSANAEASPKRVAELIEYINDNNIKVIYFEELVDPKLATMISNETGAEMLMLHAAHNVNKDELTQNITYVEIMRNNLENLKKGLNNE